jgi:hypothetical protein
MNDSRLPQKKMRGITILVRNGAEPTLQSFLGRWLAQHLDRATGERHSIAQRADGVFVAITKWDNDEAVAMRDFADIEAVRGSDLDIGLKRAAESATPEFNEGANP